MSTDDRDPRVFTHAHPLLVGNTEKCYVAREMPSGCLLKTSTAALSFRKQTASSCVGAAWCQFGHFSVFGTGMYVCINMTQLVQESHPCLINHTHTKKKRKQRIGWGGEKVSQWWQRCQLQIVHSLHCLVTTVTLKKLVSWWWPCLALYIHIHIHIYMLLHFGTILAQVNVCTLTRTPKFHP